MMGQKVTGVLVRLQDGQHHMVDSSDLAFKLAAEGALKQGKTRRISQPRYEK